MKAIAFIALLVVGISVLVTVGATLAAIGGIIGVFICILFGVYALYSLVAGIFRSKRR